MQNQIVIAIHASGRGDSEHALRSPQRSEQRDERREHRVVEKRRMAPDALAK